MRLVTKVKLAVLGLVLLYILTDVVFDAIHITSRL
jgi:hypothetical protein